jgi:hypothetical protein
MLAFLLIGCAPGQLEAGGETESLQTAWVLQGEMENPTGLLLTNNRLPCALNQNTDPTEALLENQTLEHVYTKEGSRLIWVPLFKEAITGEAPHPVTALYFEVIEAETLWTDQFLAGFKPTETRLETFDGSLILSQEKQDQWTGSLELDEGRILAEFHANTCALPELFGILGLLGVD